MSIPGRAPRPNRPQHIMEVLRTERMAPSLVRVWIGGPGFGTFLPNDFTDAYVKLHFVKPELGLEPPYDLATLRETLAPDDLPVTRTYSVRAVASDAIALDVVVHGDAGIAGPWAARVQPGERVVFGGPGGAFAPDPAADWHLFAGDETFAFGRRGGPNSSNLSDLLVEDRRASRAHAQIVSIDGQFHVVDESRRGTYVAPDGGPVEHVHLNVSQPLVGEGVIALGDRPDAEGVARIRYRLAIGGPDAA